MIARRIPENQALIGMGSFAVAVLGAWMAAGKIVGGDLRTLLFAALGIMACVVAFVSIRSWRAGFYIFLMALLFEDLVRKYMGNGLAFFFGKDALALVVYFSLFLAIRKGREKTFRPPFLLAFVPFFCLGVIQVFNPESPSIFYGLLGIKTYFFYFPMIFVGYALIRTEEDLRKFLLTNAVLAAVVAALGVIQAIVGNAFLNPARLAPELESLGNLRKTSPLSNLLLSLPDSVFVSSARFANYLVLAAILVMGTAGYFLLSPARGRKAVFAAMGLLVAATLLSGSRSALIAVAISIVLLTLAFLWGAPWRWKQASRLIKALRRSLIVSALSLAAIVLIFPDAAASRIAYYTETLSPDSSTYQLGYRTWDYPIDALAQAFTRPNWVLGNGIGTASLGTQYVWRISGERPPDLWVEEGFGVLIVEMGIVAPFLWILWAAALWYYMWQIVRRLRETQLFPIGMAIFWFAFLLLGPLTFGGLSVFQNYICNVYLWLSVGMLFRFPELLANPPAPVTTSSHGRRGTGRFSF